MAKLTEFILTVSLLSWGIELAVEGNPAPVITFNRIGEKWQNVTARDGFAVYAPNGDDLFVACKAPFPIQWNITGLIAPAEIVKIQPPTRNLKTKTFEIKVNIFYQDAEDFSGLVTSASIACEMINDYRNYQQISVFVKGNQPLLQPQSNTVLDSKVIPCPTTDPTVPTRLYLRNSAGAEILVQDVIYDPIVGFRSNKTFFGVYTCRKESASVTITARTSTSGQSDYEFSPSSGLLREISKMIEIKCSSKGKRIMMVFDENSNASITYTVNTEQMKVAQIHVPENFTGTIQGKAVCLAEGRELVKEWTFEFIEAPDLYLDNFEGEADCLSEQNPKIVQTVRCINKMHCEFMSHCFRNTSLCNFKKQKQFYAEADTFCWIQKLEKGQACATVPYSHYNGLVQCTTLGLKRQWEFFVSLNLLRYSNWKDAPEEELVRMDEVPDILYTNETSKIFCTASAYLFADSLTFEIEYKNGSRSLLENDGDYVNISNPNSESTRKIDEVNVLGEMNIKLPIDAVAIHCVAPWWNSTDVMKMTRRFETRHLLSPSIIKSNNEAKQSFYTGEEHRRLTCFAKGEPQPSYQWLFRKENKAQYNNVSEVFPELKTSIGSDGEGYLEFLKVDQKYSGQYKCIAINRLDKITNEYLLDVSDRPIIGSVVYITVVVVILLILAVVLGALLIFMRRYQQAKELVRSLTDSEIDEFFQGRPDLLKTTQPNSQEVIDFLPYDKEFEIGMGDIEFDTSEQSMLGSGEFSYVVRGKIISKSQPAAIKISKPSADVTLFKSLLSEVKIMIFIGKHENIVGLIGVSTEGIRNRSIYIATEICGLGSLDTFLRKRRREFVNLIDANQQINLELLPGEPAEVSTLDLIYFAAQIAKGMEYLAFKSVVHADLAGRNVLLTTNRIAKISDFGLSKKLYECNNYVKKTKSPLPWRWMAVESLTTLTFSTKSDIWSYGATLFEVFTLGDIPFPNEEWNKEFLTRLSSGMRMGRPKYSTQDIYSKIVACWENDPELRPDFSKLRSYFEQLLKQFKFNSENETPPLYANHDPETKTLPQNYSKFEQRQYVNTDGEELPRENVKGDERPTYTNLDLE